MNPTKDDMLQDKTTGTVGTVTDVGPGGLVEIKDSMGTKFVTPEGLKNYEPVGALSPKPKQGGLFSNVRDAAYPGLTTKGIVWRGKTIPGSLVTTLFDQAIGRTPTERSRIADLQGKLNNQAHEYLILKGQLGTVRADRNKLVNREKAAEDEKHLMAGRMLGLATELKDTQDEREKLKLMLAMGIEFQVAQDLVGRERAGCVPMPVEVVGKEEVRYTARERVLKTAKSHVMGDRNNAYGPPTQDFDRTAGMLNALYKHMLKDGEQFKGSDVARIVILIKMSRSVHQSKEDNWIDTAGYAACGAECEEAEAKLGR